MLFGARGLAWSGGLVTILGVLFFFVLAVDRGWIGPIARVSLGAIASALVFGGGLWLHRRYGDTYAASSAVAAGIAGGFATLLFASARYDLLPDLAALAAAAALAAIATATALAWGSADDRRPRAHRRDARADRRRDRRAASPDDRGHVVRRR